jgi:hypothetical protein
MKLCYKNCKGRKKQAATFAKSAKVAPNNKYINKYIKKTASSA